METRTVREWQDACPTPPRAARRYAQRAAANERAAVAVLAATTHARDSFHVQVAARVAASRLTTHSAARDLRQAEQLHRRTLAALELRDRRRRLAARRHAAGLPARAGVPARDDLLPSVAATLAAFIVRARAFLDAVRAAPLGVLALEPDTHRTTPTPHELTDATTAVRPRTPLRGAPLAPRAPAPAGAHAAA
jgi:hypothetical protein